MDEIIISNISVEEYETFLNNQQKVNYLQSAEEYKKAQLDKKEAELIGFYQNKKLCGAGILLYTPYAKVFKKCYVPRGFVMDYTQADFLRKVISSLKKYLSKKKVLFLAIDPDIILLERDNDGNPVGKERTQEIQNLESAGFIHEQLTYGHNKSSSSWQSRFVSVLNVEGKSEDELFKEFSYHTRQDIRSTEKYCVKVRELEKKDFPFLDEMEKRTAERHHFQSLDVNFYNNLYDAFGKDKITIAYSYLDIDAYSEKIQSEFEKVQASINETKAFLLEHPGNTKKEKKLKTDEEFYNSLQKKISQVAQLREEFGKEVPLSCCIFIRYRKEMHYFVGASEYSQKMFKGPYATQWYMIRKALKEGCTRYNFLGISGKFKPGEEGYGVFDFKRGFNATVEEYIGNFILPVKPFFYNLLTKVLDR